MHRFSRSRRCTRRRRTSTSSIPPIISPRCDSHPRHIASSLAELLASEAKLPEPTDSIRSVLAERDMTQDELGRAVAAREGRSRPYTQADVASWFRRNTLAVQPSRLMLVEEVLEVPAGYFSRPLGWVPATAVPSLSVPDAIMTDHHLSRTQKQDLLAVYDVMTRRDT